MSFCVRAPRLRFEPELSKFYIAEIVLAFEYLHGMHIAYRDLKPEVRAPRCRNSTSPHACGMNTYPCAPVAAEPAVVEPWAYQGDRLWLRQSCDRQVG